VNKPRYRRPGGPRATELDPALRSVVESCADDPLVAWESVRDDGRGIMIRSWELHGPNLDELLARGLEYEVTFPVAKRPDGVKAPSRLLTIVRPRPITIETRTFGPITLPRTGAVLVDGGTDGRPGHRLDVDISGSALWERRIGIVSRGGCAGNGSLGIHGRDWADYLQLSDVAWQYMKRPAPAPAAGSAGDVPGWLWVVALRLGDEVRVRESLAGGGEFPAPPIAALLDWMARRVEGWCVASSAPECAAPEPVPVAIPVPPPSSGHVGGGIGDAVARVRNDGWGPIIPPLKRGD
jgi:hypothetical protein